MTKNTSTAAVTPADDAPEPTTPEATPAPVTPTTTPVTASIPTGQKSPALFGGNFPVDWAGSRAIAVNSDGSEFAFLIATGDVYQGRIVDVSPRALAYGYALGARRKADADGAGEKNTQKGIDTAIALSGDSVVFSDWCAPRVSGPREETATPVSLQVKALLIAKLKAGGLGAAIKAKKIKLTGFTGGTNSLFTRYAAVVKEATGMEATAEQWEGFTSRTLDEATAAIAAIAEDPFA